MSHDSYPAHVEPSVAVNPRNPLNLLAASQLYGRRHDVLGTYVSFDGGATWHDNGPLPTPRGANTGDDVTVAFDEHGTGYVAAMMTNATAAGLSQNDRGLYVWRTLDGGRTFKNSVAVVRHGFVDHPWLAVGPGARGHGNVYVVWVTSNHAGLGFSRSGDSGRHFAAPRTVSTPRAGVSVPVVAAGPHGAVYASFLASRGGTDAPGEADTAEQRPERGNVSVDVVTSLDSGAHFSGAHAVGSSRNRLQPEPTLSLPTGPSIAVDPRSGTLYVTYAAGGASSSTSDVRLARSTDNGGTWDTPTTVATGASTDQAYFQPQVAVDDRDGVSVSLYSLGQESVNVDLAHSADDGQSFGPLATVTTSPFLPSLGIRTAKTGEWWIGDYQGLATGPGDVYLVWGDTLTGELQIFSASVPVTDLG